MDLYSESTKVCPIDGHVLGTEDYDCFFYDCSNRSMDKYEMLHGIKYHCGIEKRRIEKQFQKEQIKKKKIEELEKSKHTASKISIEEFYEYCREIEKKLSALKQTYGPNMTIKPYHKEDEKWIIAIFNGDEMIEIAASDNVISYINSKFDKLLDDELVSSVGMCTLPSEIADAVVTKLKLNRRMDVARNVHSDNPVYIKRKDIAKYVKAAYGYEWWDFDKLRKNHLELTEIVNYGIVIYLKPEIDQIIRYDNMLSDSQNP